METFGGLDIIVNNAGYTWDNVIQKMTDEQFQAMLDVHLVAPFRMLRAASGHIREKAKQEAAEGRRRSEEHTSELQSLTNLVCRLLLEKKKKKKKITMSER